MSRPTRGRFAVEAITLHALLAVAVGTAWWALAPSLTYTVFDGEAFVLDETAYQSIFAGDAVLALLCALAGLVAGGVLLARGYRSAALPVVLAVGGVIGSALAWWLAVALGPGRLDDLVAVAGEGDVVPGPELSSLAVLVVWSIVAVAAVFVVAAFSEPERRGQPSSPASGG